MTTTPHVCYPIVQLRPNTVLVYLYYPDRRKFTYQNTFQFQKEEKPQKAYSGLLTSSARNKLRTAISLLVAQATWKDATNYELNKTFKFRCNFITLTLSAPQGSRTDKEIKRVCLNNFLNRAKKLWKMDTYVWRAEKQKNTNIHFHITTDVFIHYRDLCKVWNECQELLGFVTEFRERTGSYQPNSTDIHAIHDVQNLAAYLVKYMSKGEKDAQLIDGKVWGCSSNLLNAQKYECEVDSKHDSYLRDLFTRYQEKVYQSDNCTMLTLPEATFYREIPKEWRDGYDRYLKSVKEYRPKQKQPKLALSPKSDEAISLPSRSAAVQTRLDLYNDKASAYGHAP